MLNYQKQKPSTLNFCDFLLQSQSQLTPSTPNIINSFQDMTPTNVKHIIDSPDSDNIGRTFSRHYKLIEERYQMPENSTTNFNNSFTLDLLNSNDEICCNSGVLRPHQSPSSCSSGVQSSSEESINNFSSSGCNQNMTSYVGPNDSLKLSAKKRELNRQAAEKCRLKKQHKINELRSEKCRRIQHNDKLVERVVKKRERVGNLETLLHRILVGDINLSSSHC